VTHRDEPSVPDGFRVAAGYCGPFISHCGPLFGRFDGEELVLGFRVLARHGNPLETAHGGMLASLADMLQAASAMYRREGWGRILPTISLQLDFLAPARLGAWVEGRAEILKTSGSMIFSQGMVRADGEPALRASGILKLGPISGDFASWDPLELRSAARFQK
jgi:uncharacterized protein (TIGR00369 family)